MSVLKCWSTFLDRGGVAAARYAAWPLLGLLVVYWLAAALIELYLVRRTLLIAHQAVAAPFTSLPVWLVVTVGWSIFVPLWLVLTAGFLRPRLLRIAVVIATAAGFGLVHQLYWFLLLYHWRSGLTFDFAFFWFNRGDALTTVARSFGPEVLWALGLLGPAFAVFWLLLAWSWISRPRSERNWLQIGTSALLLVAVLGALLGYREFTGELSRFVHTFGNAGRGAYATAYARLLERSASAPQRSGSLPADAPRRIIFVQLESVSGDLVRPTTTPTLYRYAQRGVLFPRFYSNGVQTIRSQESLLCGLPPSVGDTLVNSYPRQQLQRLPCLPRLLREAGYRTIVFKNDHLTFAHGDRWLSAIGFDELHDADITEPGDPLLPWGYREDVYFRRVVEVLRRAGDERVFALIAVSGTNHYPWPAVEDPAMRTSVPFPTPRTFREQLINTTFVQDAYLGQLLEALEEMPGTMVFAYSDTGFQMDRIGNFTTVEYDVRDGSFSSFLLAVPPKENPWRFSFGQPVAEARSQMDILPTIVDLLQLPVSPTLLGRSLRDPLQGRPAAAATSILMLQPYTRPRLALLRFPLKYLVDFQADTVSVFDLAQDPLELSPRPYGGAPAVAAMVAEIFRPAGPAAK